MRTILKFLKYSLFTFVGILLLVVTLTFIFQDKIIELAFGEINKHLATRIEIDRNVKLSVFEKFPEMSIKVKNVKIYESYIGSDEKLAELQTLYFTFDAYDLFKGKYVLKNIYAENGEINIRINENGLGNYFITKKDTSNTQSNLSFDLQKIDFENVLISYDNIPVNQKHKVHAQKLISKLKLVDKSWFIGLEGNAQIHYVGIGGNEYFKNKTITIHSNQEFHQDKNLFKILPSEIHVEGAKFNLTGSYEGNTQKYLQLDLKAEKATFGTLLSLLPGQLSNELKSYKSSGNIYFDAKIDGRIDATERPSVDINFGFENASFSHPSVNKRIVDATLKGNFSNGPEHNLSTSRLKLTNIHALLDNRAFEGNFSLINFEDPFLQFDFKGTVDLSSLIHFLPTENIELANGTLNLDIAFEGKLAHLKHKEDQTKVKAEGTIQLDSVNLKFKNSPLAFNSFNGEFSFDKNDVNVPQLSGRVGKSDISIKGSLKNLVYKVLTGKETLGIDGELRSSLLDLDELQSAFTSPNSNSDTSKKDLSKEYKIRLNYRVDELRFRKLNAKELSGTLEWNNSIASLKNINLKTAGGKIHSTTIFNLQNSKRIEVSTNTEITSINIDSILYICDNFNQEFIQDKNLKGVFTGHINCTFYMTNDLVVKTNSVTATIDASIKNGELNNFEPMKKLARFIDEKELENIRFSELKNKILIEDNKIIIPEMEIKSNISTISVMGTHTFDQEMDYKLAIPLKDFKKNHPDKDEAFGAIEDDNKGNSLLFITIKGNTSNYKIAYDTKRTGKKIKNDLKKEKQELQDLFKKKKTEQVVTTPSPSETEFFDF